MDYGVKLYVIHILSTVSANKLLTIVSERTPLMTQDYSNTQLVSIKMQFEYFFQVKYDQDRRSRKLLYD